MPTFHVAVVGAEVWTALCAQAMAVLIACMAAFWSHSDSNLVAFWRQSGFAASQLHYRLFKLWFLHVSTSSRIHILKKQMSASDDYADRMAAFCQQSGCILAAVWPRPGCIPGVFSCVLTMVSTCVYGFRSNTLNTNERK